jgi:hypothetical protein
MVEIPEQQFQGCVCRDPERTATQLIIDLLRRPSNSFKTSACRQAKPRKVTGCVSKWQPPGVSPEAIEKASNPVDKSG